MRKALLLVSVLAAGVSSAHAQTEKLGMVGIMTGMPSGTYAQTAFDLETFDDPKAPLRVVPMLGKGSLRNLLDILHLRGVDAAFVQADALPYALANHLITPDQAKNYAYISKLYDEEVHILARSGINSLADLEGKQVNVDVEGSGSALTAKVLFGVAKVNPRFSNMRQPDALLDLESGKIDAIFHVGGAPIPLLKGVQSPDLHFVPVELTPDLAETYLPSDLTHDEYPNLISEDQSQIRTISIADVFAVYNWDPNSERGKNVQRLVDSFFTHFDDLLAPGRHPKWKSVEPSAEVPGWTRFPAAQALLDERMKLQSMKQYAADHGLPPMTKQQEAQLFRDFLAFEKSQRPK
jgi:TRAP transporter TAXI family solute receptor